MRLDTFLVELGKISSRNRAKQAILNGKVKVDGAYVTKPSRQVGFNNTIEVMDGVDVPAGYMKLRSIQEQTNLIRAGETVLDLGSSAGGFLMYASERAALVMGIEFSDDFFPKLQALATLHDNISIVKGDVFSLSLSEISGQQVDVILNDITVEPEDSLFVLARVLPLLRPGGKVLQVLKLSTRSGIDEYLSRIREMGLTIMHLIEPHKREIYVVAVHNSGSEANQ